MLSFGHILICLLVDPELSACRTLAAMRGRFERADQMTPPSKFYSIKTENGGSRRVYAHLVPQAERKIGQINIFLVHGECGTCRWTLKTVLRDEV